MDNVAEQLQIESLIPTAKIYSRKAIYGATFLGGPLVSGYLVAENFKVFGEAEKARMALMISIVFTIVIFGISFLIGSSGHFPSYIIPLMYSYVASLLVQEFQGKKIQQHLDAGGLTYGFWPVFGIALLGLVITVLILFAVVYMI